MSKVPILGCSLLLILFLLRFRDHPFSLAEFPTKDCDSFRAWLKSRFTRFPEIQAALPLPNEDIAFEDANGMWPKVASDILAWSGWPIGTKFAKFQKHTLEQLLTSASLQAGAFVIVIPGPPLARGSLTHRGGPTETWIEAKPPSLAAALPLQTLETLSHALETKLGGRKLPRFTIEAAAVHALPLCKSGGACAIWEGSTGRILLDADVARRMSFSPTIAALLDTFTRALASQLLSVASFDAAGTAVEGGEILEAVVTVPSLRKEYFHRSSVNGGQDTATEEDPDKKTSGSMGSGNLASNNIANTIATAGTAALTVLLASQLPLWWCLACPITLGLLAPFIFNFGLTAAAEQMCAVLELPSDECADLWWGAFALALVLSLGAAVPIVYICRLPDCVKHAVNAGAATLAVGATAVAAVAGGLP